MLYLLNVTLLLFKIIFSAKRRNNFVCDVYNVYELKKRKIKANLKKWSDKVKGLTLNTVIIFY